MALSPLTKAARAHDTYVKVSARAAESVSKASDRRDTEVLAAWHSGSSLSEIATALGLTKARVQQLVERARVL